MKATSPSAFHTVVCCAVAVGLLAVAGCDVEVGDRGVSVGLAQGKATEEWTRTYTLPHGGHLDIDNINGTITLEPSTDSRVQVHALREARDSSDQAARKLLADVKMVEEVAPDHVRVDVGGSGGNSFSLRRSVSVRYDVHLPPGLIVSARTQNGAIQINDVTGTMTVAATNGGITARNVSGGITATTVNGGVLLALSEVSADVAARTVNGGVRIEIPADARADLDASVVNGGVSVDGALNLSGGDRGRRHVSGSMNGGGPRITAQTTNGGVRIYGAGRDVSRLRSR